MIRILIADDHGLLRAGLRSLLKSEPEMGVVGEAADGYEALGLAAELKPDIVLADITMPGPSGIDLAQQLRRTLPATRVLIMTMHEDAELLHEALQAGAAGYLIKRAAETDLIRAIQAVSRGETYIHEAMKPPPSPTQPPAPPQRPAAQLSSQEHSVLLQIVQGKSNHQIAQELGVDLPTVDGIRAAIMQKLNVRTRVGLIHYAREQNLM